MQEKFWVSDYGMRASTDVAAILYNKYKTWDKLVTNLLVRCAYGYSLLTASHPDFQPCG